MKDYLDRMKLFLSARSIAQTMSVIAKSGLFDARWYASQAPEAARSGMGPLRHYVVFGAAAGLNPHPLFDAHWYLSQYSCDPPTRPNPLLHYLSRGARANRQPPPPCSTPPGTLHRTRTLPWQIRTHWCTTLRRGRRRAGIRTRCSIPTGIWSKTRTSRWLAPIRWRITWTRGCRRAVTRILCSTPIGI